MPRVVAAALVLVAAVSARSQLEPFIPVGVLTAGADVSIDRQDLLSLAKRRFNVVAVRDASGDLRLTRIADLLDASRSPLPIPSTGVVVVSASRGAGELRRDAWQAIARGARGVLFEPLSFEGDDDALAAASEFADNLTRNAALFAPLRPREKPDDVQVADVPPGAIDARILESNAALVIIAVNQTSDVRRATLKFSNDFPEAIWQNMENGAAVNFVASAQGPTYTRTFTPFDVIVLMIRKQYR
jgi:hypothetical protein